MSPRPIPGAPADAPVPDFPMTAREQAEALLRKPGRDLDAADRAALVTPSQELLAAAKAIPVPKWDTPPTPPVIEQPASPERPAQAVKVYEHTIRPKHARAGLPLIVKVTCTYEGDTMDYWDLALQGISLSPENRTTLMRILHAPVRDGLSGSGFGAKWEAPDRVEIWDQHRTWSFSRKQARDLGDEILRAIGRADNDAKEAARVPFPWEAVTPDAVPVEQLAAKITQLEAENAELRKLVAFYKQYAPQ